MKITVIHPSMGNPEGAYSAFYRWMSHASIDFEYILSLNSDDKDIQKYMLIFSRERINVCVGVGGIVQAANRAAERATGDIIICISDKSMCDKGWDYKIQELVEGKEIFSLLTVNGESSNENIFIPMISKTLYHLMGYYFHPLFNVDYFDRYLYQLCIRKYNCLIECDTVKFNKRKIVDEKYLTDNQRDEYLNNCDKDRATFNYLSNLNGWNLVY